jgi:hypothetical protein
MSDSAPRLERLLGEALVPIEPPEQLIGRLEDALTNVTELAAVELDAWELSAMRDPRRWLRPAAALVVGGAAASGLVLLRARRRSQNAPPTLTAVRENAENTLRDIGSEARRLLGDP